MYRLFPRFLVKSRDWRDTEKTLSARRLKRRFTLLEILVAFVITGTIIAGAMGILKTSLWAANYYSHRTSASNIANSRIERLRTIPYADLDSMTEDAAPVNGRGISDANGDFTRTTTLGSDYFNTRVVTVTVEGHWKYDQPPVEVSVTSIIANDVIVQ